ncbi:MAG: DUF2953 domain-containing protein [Ruminococcaceae bacterium]|nr:DUF2953 domain-containing protein [Oscillospiraceae bacterium]
MKIFLIVVAIILAFITLLLFSPLKIIVEYRDKKVKLIFRCAFLKFTVKDSAFRKKEKTAKSNNKKTDDAPNDGASRIKKMQTGFDSAKDALDEILDLVKHRARFSDIYVRLRYGTGDAANTGILYGAIWSLTGNVYAYLCRHFYVEFPTVELEPQFDKTAFEIEAQGIITTRLVHIIKCVIKLLPKLRAGK